MTRLTRREKKDAARKVAEAVFLEFYENTSWAHDKIASGTASLTPEAVAYMRSEIVRRKDAGAHEKDLADQNAAIDLAAKQVANAE